MENKRIDLEELNLEEMEQTMGAGITKAQCAWFLASCVNYIPGVGAGCGGNQSCNYYKMYC